VPVGDYNRHICIKPYHNTGEGMTFCNHTPEPRTVSTPSTTDDFRYRYAKTEMVVLADPRLTQNDKTVYATLKAHRNHLSGVAWPSRRLIGQIAGCTENHVTKSTRRLVEAGYLLKEQRPGRATVFRFPLADAVNATPIQTDWGERSTPIQTDGHNKQRFSSEQTKEPQPQQPAHERHVGSVVVDFVSSEPTILTAPEPASCVTPEPTTPEPSNPAEPDPEPASCVTQEPATPEPSNPAEPDPEPASCATPEPTTPEPSNPAEPDPEPASCVTQEPATPEPSNPAEPALSFPAIITLAAQAGMVRILCGLPFADAQMLLDELAGAAQQTAIRNPIAYLRRLLSLHLSGTLIPEHAERIAALRAAQARNEAARQRALAMRLDERPPDIPKPKKPRDHSARLAAMEQMRSILGYREPGAG
jgi:hypothetical protein